MEERRAMSYLAVEGKVHPEKPAKKKARQNGVRSFVSDRDEMAKLCED